MESRSEQSAHGPQSGSVALGDLLSVFLPQFPCLQNGDSSTCCMELSWRSHNGAKHNRCGHK